MRPFAALAVALCVLTACHAKSNSAGGADASGPAPGWDAIAGDDPDIAAVAVTVDGRPLYPAAVTAVLTNRLGEKDPKKAPTLLVTLENRTRESLTFDIPWKEAELGDRPDAKVSFALRRGMYVASGGAARASITRLDRVDGQFVCDANLDATVTKVGGVGSAEVKASFKGLRVRGLPKLLQHQ